jgi:predicted regulator of Ras-like GTPase activity (Roadblock/LC7/MglB family)
MSFKDELSSLMSRVPGLLGVLLADWEGEAVDYVARMDDFELRVAGAHKGVILNQIREALPGLKDDPLEEIVITTRGARTLVMPITADYFLVLLLERKESQARALFEGRRCRDTLRIQIA